MSKESVVAVIALLILLGILMYASFHVAAMLACAGWHDGSFWSVEKSACIGVL